MKKFFAIALAVVTLAAVFPMTASAAGGVRICIKAPCGTPMPPSSTGSGTSGWNRKGSGGNLGTGTGGGRNLPPTPAGK